MILNNLESRSLRLLVSIAVPAIHRPALGGLERHLALCSTLGTRGLVHFSRSKTASKFTHVSFLLRIHILCLAFCKQQFIMVCFLS